MSYLKTYQEEIESCIGCGLCGVSCPTFGVRGFDSNTPRGRMVIARALLEGRLELTDAVVERILNCCDCGYCAVRCSPDIIEAIRAVKAEIAARGKMPMPGMRVAEYVAKNHNLSSRPHEERFAWLPEELRSPRRADVLFYVGCGGSYSVPGECRATVKIMDKAGVKWTTLGEDEWCCGYILYELGAPDKVQEAAQHNVSALNHAVESLGVRKVVFQCAACLHFFRTYPQRFGLTIDPSLEMLHVTEFFNELIEEGKIRFKEWNGTCVYHDNCVLGRREGIYEAPRENLRAIPQSRLVEMEHNRYFSRCCSGMPRFYGAHSSYGLEPDAQSARYRELANALTEKRIKEAEESGADVLVTACTGCQRTLGLMAQKNHAKVKVRMLSEVLADLLV